MPPKAIKPANVQPMMLSVSTTLSLGPAVPAHEASALAVPV